MPNESVDPFSGSLSIVETDLVLPGNAGFDLRVQRVYTSAIYPGYQNNDLTIEEDSWAGIGWKLHFGRVINPTATTGGATQIEMGDGSRQALYTTSVSPGWITKSFWLYDKSGHTLKLPNGLVYTFGHTVNLGGTLGVVRYVTEIRDPFNNRVEFSYFAAPGPVDGVSQIRQYLGNGQMRQIDFTFNATVNSLATMTYGTKVWTYTQDPGGPAGFSLLKAAQPPVGPATQYSYSTAAPGHELTVLQTPGGGTVTYTYTTVTQQSSSVITVGRGVATKVLNAGVGTPGTWTYAYATGPNHDTTRIECPCGTTTYRFNGIGLAGNFSGWLAGTLAEQTTEQGSTVLERTVTTWIPSEGISTDPTVGVGGIWTDTGVFKALLQSQVVTRGTQSWTTTHEYHSGLGNFNDYGRPWRTFEDGELHRRIQRVFQYGFTPYIVDRVADQEVIMGAQVSETHSQYDAATGFLTRQVRGPTTPNPSATVFVPTAEGNVQIATDPLGNITTFAYAWGRTSSTTTPGPPAVTTNYAVNPDGTIASEATGGLTTLYFYDNAFRLVEVRPPSAAGQTSTPITYDYDNTAASYVIVRRLPSATDSRFDGFGRVIKTTDQFDVKARTERDACGRTTFTSYPYSAGTGTRGVVTTHDALGRVLSVTEGIGVNQGVTTYAYTGLDVTVTDPNNRVTIYDYSAFGGPDSSQLMVVKDADLKFTTYTYDVFGHLATVNGPNATGAPGTSPARAWLYNALGQLVQDTQPEKGTTTYLPDLAGNVLQVTDAAGTTTFTYDASNRLKTRNAAGTADDAEFVYGALGELRTIASPTVATATTSIAYDYDLAGRLNRRTDVVNGHTFVSQYLQNADDSLQQITYPHGRIVSYTYVSGRVSGVYNAGSPFATGFTYDDAGRLASYVTGAVTHTTTYDDRERVKTLASGPSGAGLALTYDYDKASQVIGVADTRPYMSQTFAYDAVGRMWAANGPYGALRWTYDAAGNRLTEARGATTYYSYDAPTQRLSSTSGAVAESFTYDSVGRLTSDSQGTYTYNERGLLAGVSRTGLIASYGYDPAGLRSTRTVNTDTTYTIRGAGGEVLSEYLAPCGSTPVWSRDVIYAGGRPLGAVRSATPRPTVSMTTPSTTVSEALSSVIVHVQVTTLTGPLACPVTVAYDTVPGSAILGVDFVNTQGTVTFPAGSASGSTRAIVVPLVPDAANEPTKGFEVGLTGATGAVVTAPAGTSITIEDDDPMPMLTVTSPSPGATVKTPFVLTGWALDGTAPSGTGIDLIHVYAASSTGASIFLGAATYGSARPAVAAAYGSRFLNAGFDLTVTLAPGVYGITVYARSGHTGAYQTWSHVVTVAAPDPRMTLDEPGAGWHQLQPFALAGSAIDLAAGAGVGVDRVEVLAYPNPGSGAAPVSLGDATLGLARPDVASTFGAQFLTSGYRKDVRGLAPGLYRFVAQARSTVSGTVVLSREVTVTVYANPQMWTDVPAPNASVNQTFTIGGWAVDRAAATGTGVSTLQVWAFPNPGSGQPGIFLGVPTFGPRPDIAAAFGPQFLNAGFGLTATLPPGLYNLHVAAWSTVTNAFNQSQTYPITVATSQPVISIELPTASSTVSQPFSVTGWTVDLGSPDGPGIDAVDVHVVSNSGAGTWTYLGRATSNVPRPDVAAFYGHPRFTNAGWGLTASGLAPGSYQMYVFAHSTVSGQWSWQALMMTVQ